MIFFISKDARGGMNFIGSFLQHMKPRIVVPQLHLHVYSIGGALLGETVLSEVTQHTPRNLSVRTPASQSFCSFSILPRLSHTSLLSLMEILRILSGENQCCKVRIQPFTFVLEFASGNFLPLILVES